jgi:hypothetical protein
MSADVIFLFRVKTIAFATLPLRLAPVEKFPAKRGDFKSASPRWRLAAAGDPLAGLHDNKLPARARRGGKLRLFRVWKLYGDLKADGAAPAAYRALADRLREQRWLRRL